MSVDQVAAVREVRRKLSVEGPPVLRDAPGDFGRISVPVESCDALRDLLVAERVSRVVEVGLAYAASSLAIGEALLVVGGSVPSHVVIDPFQESAWSGVGWELLRSAGLDGIARLEVSPSSLALPGLLAEGYVADAAFVDGSHRFHEVFVDLYFLRKLVRPGGVIVLDDIRWPSVATAVRYFERDLGFEPVATGSERLAAYRMPEPFEPDFESFQPF